ncbi:Hypothetical predicted protein, partial [Paramuricea clavata]
GLSLKKAVKIIKAAEQTQQQQQQQVKKMTGDLSVNTIKENKGYTGERRNITGKVTLPVWHEGKKQLIKFNIIDGDYRPILFLDTSIAFVIVNLRHCDILPLGIQPHKDPASEYKDVFDGSLIIRFRVACTIEEQADASTIKIVKIRGSAIR